jgi:hypothetical protein
MAYGGKNVILREKVTLMTPNLMVHNLPSHGKSAEIRAVSLPGPYVNHSI